MMKMNKEKFLKSELGINLQECIAAWDKYLLTGAQIAALRRGAEWGVYQTALKQFYGVEYCFSRTDEYFGVCTEDGTNWLFKVER